MPYELELVTPEERQTPEHRARHPLGRVPVLEDDSGGYVIKSAAIVLHVANRAPEGRLIPTPGTHERALVYQWLVFGMTELESKVIESLHPDAERAGAGKEASRAAAVVVDDALEGPGAPGRRRLHGRGSRRGGGTALRAALGPRRGLPEPGRVPGTGPRPVRRAAR